MSEATLSEVVALLASGEVRIKLDEDCRPELVTNHPSLGPIWDQLCRGGWLEPMANGGTWKLSDAGLLAYLRSTDEMGDGKLIAPCEIGSNREAAK